MEAAAAPPNAPGAGEGQSAATPAGVGGWAAVLESRPSKLRRAAASGPAPAPAAPGPAASVPPPAGTAGSAIVDAPHHEAANRQPRASRRQPGYSSLMSWQRLRLDVRKGAPLRLIPMAEVEQHCTLDDAWTVFRSKVYAISEYCNYHPGGADVLRSAAGKDCTSLFERYHRWVNGEALLGKWCARKY